MALGLVFILNQNLEAWKAAQAAVREIDLHPNRPAQSQEQSQQSHAGPSTLHPQTEDVSKLGVDAMKNEIEKVEIADKPLPKPSLTETGGDGPVPSLQPRQGNDIEEHEGNGPLGPL